MLLWEEVYDENGDDDNHRNNDDDDNECDDELVNAFMLYTTKK